MFGSVLARPSPVQFQSPITGLIRGIGAGQQMAARKQQMLMQQQQMQRAQQMQPFLVQQAQAKVPLMGAQTTALTQKSMYPGIGTAGQSGDLEKLRFLINKFGVNSPEASSQRAIIQGTHEQATKVNNLSPAVKTRTWNQMQSYNIAQHQKGLPPISYFDYLVRTGTITDVSHGLSDYISQIGRHQGTPSPVQGAPAPVQQSGGQPQPNAPLQVNNASRTPTLNITQAQANASLPAAQQAQAKSFQETGNDLALEQSSNIKMQPIIDDTKNLMTKVHLGPGSSYQDLTNSQYQSLKAAVNLLQTHNLLGAKNIRTQREFNKYIDGVLKTSMYRKAFLHRLEFLQSQIDTSEEKGKFYSAYKKRGGRDTNEFVNQWGAFLKEGGYNPDSFIHKGQPQAATSQQGGTPQQSGAVTIISPGGKSINVSADVAHKLSSQGWRMR